MRLLHLALLASSAFFAGSSLTQEEAPVFLTERPGYRQDSDDWATVRPSNKAYWDRMAAVDMTVDEATKMAVEHAINKGYDEARAISCELMLAGKPYYMVSVFTKHEKVPKDAVEGEEVEPITVYRRWEVRVGVTMRTVKFWMAQHRFPGKPTNGPDMVTLPSGVMFNDQAPGDGQFVTEDSTVKVHYTMLTLDGTLVFDTYKDKNPRSFKLTEAPIPGLREGLLGARVGGKRKIVIPPSMAWGDNGLRDIVPPNATVVFDLEVRNVR